MKIQKKENLVRIMSLSIIILVYIAYCFIEVNITGMITYDEIFQTKTWDFDNPSDYTYNDSLINIENGNVELIPTTTTTYWNTSTATDYSITSALYNPDDKTSKANTLNNKKHEIKNNKIFDIFFDQNLDNGDTISIYIKEGQQTDIYLCDKATSCSSPGYGLVNYDAGEGDDDGEGWYNITISNINSPTNAFNLN
tara:strand:+ start:2411 stop:2998 length:588 start_codon:yes stop_codon:yes gene_type:complete